MPFTPENLKTLYDKRITPEYLKLLRQNEQSAEFHSALKDDRNNVVREVKDPTGITSKTYELFSYQTIWISYEWGLSQSTAKGGFAPDGGRPWINSTGPGSGSRK